MARVDLKLEIDWRSDGQYDHPHSDVSACIDSFSLGYGMGLLNNPADFSISVLAGEARMLTPLPIAEDQGLYLRHRCRVSINDRPFCAGFITRVSDRVYRIESRNQELLQADIEIPIAASLTDAALFQRILSAAGLTPSDTNYFNGYTFADLIIMRGSVRSILSDFAKLAGGYVLEDGQGRIAFAAPRARLGESGTTFVDPLQTAIFELDISNKPGAIRNKVSTAIPIIATVAGQSIRDVAVELDPGSDQTLDVPAPRDSLVTSWTAAVDNDKLTLSVQDTSDLRLRLNVSNADAAKQAGTIAVTGAVKSVAATQALETERLGSIGIWGVIPFDDLKEWLGSVDALEQELSRRDSPLRTANLEMPIESNILSWVFLEPGSLTIVNHDDLTVNMMLGRKYVTFSRAVADLRWHLIEWPLAYPDEFWRLDDGDFRLGINTYLGDATIPMPITILGGHLLYFAGQDMAPGDDLIYMNDHLHYMNDQVTYFDHPTGGDRLTYMNDHLTYF